MKMIEGIRDVLITLACIMYIHTSLKGMAALEQLQGLMGG